MGKYIHSHHTALEVGVLACVLTVLVLALVTPLARAQVPGYPQNPEDEGRKRSSEDLNDQAQASQNVFIRRLAVVLNIVWFIIMVLFAASMIKNGVTIMVATSPQAAEEGKEGVKKALMGLSIAISAGVIAGLILLAFGIKVPPWNWG